MSCGWATSGETTGVRAVVRKSRGRYRVIPVAEAGAPVETRGMEPDPLRLELELRRAGDPIEGRLSSEHGKPVSFIGWLELIAAVEAVRADDDHERGRTEEPPRVEKGTRRWRRGDDAAE